MHKMFLKMYDGSFCKPTVLHETQIYLNKTLLSKDIKREPEDFDVNYIEHDDIMNPAYIKHQMVKCNNESASNYPNCAALFVETFIKEEQLKKDRTVQKYKMKSTVSDVMNVYNVTEELYPEDDMEYDGSNTMADNNSDAEPGKITDKIIKNDVKINGKKTAQVVLSKGNMPTEMATNISNISVFKYKLVTMKGSDTITPKCVKESPKNIISQIAKNNDQICKSSRMTAQELLRGINNGSKEEAEREALLNPNMKNKDGQVIFECRFCNKTYNSLKSYKAHSYDHKGKHMCNVCQTRFSRNSNLKVHMRRHLGEKPFACHLCKSKFSASGDLTRHLLLHTGEKPFKCSRCDNCFSQKAHLDGHLRSHSTEKPFKCPSCDLCYTQKNNLTFHMRKHAGDKPYSCKMCSAKFWGNYDLKRHVKRSHLNKND